MGSVATEFMHMPKNSLEVKVHSSMCWVLRKVLCRIGSILPAIESARPGYTSGIKELCSLHNTIEKAKLLLQHCADSSKLYLAITSEEILLRCERIRAALDQSLCQIQNMVPQLLAVQISAVVNYIRDAEFIIVSADAEAGKSILELLSQTESSEEMEFEAFQIAAIKLNVTSPTALLIERRSIQKLHDKVRGNDPKMAWKLEYLLYLLKKYGKTVRPHGNEQRENVSPIMFEINDGPSYDGGARTDLFSSNIPPEEFCFPILSRLMCDPVIIASGQTYERTCIETWFNEVHDTCPKTQNKLENLSMIPNTRREDLNSCDASYCSDTSHAKDIEAQMFEWSEDHRNVPSFRNFSQDMFLRFFYRLSELSMEIQGKAVEDLKDLLEDDEEICYAMLSNGFGQALMKFLKNTKDQSDVQAQRIGAQILLLCLSKSRGVEIQSFSEDAFQFLTSFLGTEITKEALEIMQKLVHHTNFISYVEVSGVSPQLIKILDSKDTELLELAVKILHDLSSHSEIKPHVSTTGCISRLVSLLSHRTLMQFCIRIMRNLCEREEAGRMVAKTDGCLASIGEVLEAGTYEEQEDAVAILHSLCSRSFEYCQLVEGVIPSLVYVSVNGSAKGKESSMKLLHMLRDIKA